MYDPYAVLGLSRNAQDEEVKKAYRALSRTYHPDANMNNPNREKAEEKFKEIQQAYQQIMDEKEYGYSSGYGNRQGNQGGYGDFGGFGSRGTQSRGNVDEDTTYKQAAVNYIQSGHYKEALNVLAGMKQKDAQWYYLSAIANSGAGNNIVALEHARQAAKMVPTNAQYQQLAAGLEGGEDWYQGQRQPYGTTVSGGNGFCLKILIINMICNLCCGGSGVCCGGQPYGGI
ncbi:J domain-containing protein [Lachnospiraceae bacterium ZAX-1]